MEYKLFKKLVEKKGKKYINFYLIKDNLLIQIEPKTFKCKDGTTSYTNYHLLNRTAEWIGKEDK